MLAFPGIFRGALDVRASTINEEMKLAAAEAIAGVVKPEELGPEYEILLDLLSEAREGLRATGRSTEDADWQRAFDQGIVDLVRAGRVADAKELLKSCL